MNNKTNILKYSVRSHRSHLIQDLLHATLYGDAVKRGLDLKLVLLAVFGVTFSTLGLLLTALKPQKLITTFLAI